jgi:hypothetical protein
MPVDGVRDLQIPKQTTFGLEIVRSTGNNDAPAIQMGLFLRPREEWHVRLPD